MEKVLYGTRLEELEECRLVRIWWHHGGMGGGGGGGEG